jgi:pre-rRNA-processing protein IPI1
MVRAAKATKVKKKPGDFKRPKRKVGRRAPQAANVTNVGVTSRRINLLEQSVLADKGDAAVTHRNLTLQDLLAMVSHYNAHMRQRALQGLRELATQPAAAANLLANVSVALERFLPAFVDEEAVVRDAAVSAWKAMLPVLVHGKSLSPFAPLIAVYFCSGLTHLQVGIRKDTLRAISALLEVAPELICVEAGSEHLGRLIENFKDLIAAAQAQGIKVKNSYNLLTAETGAKKGKAKKAASSGLALRFEGLTVLHKLLSSMSASSSPSVQPSAGSQSARSCSVTTTRTLLLYASPTLVVSRASAGRASAQFWQEKSRSLLKPLLDLWLECFENDAVDSLPEDYVEHLHYIVECVGLITAANAEHLVTLDAKHPLMKTILRLQDELLLQRFPMFPSSIASHESDPSQARWFAINVSLAKFACIFLTALSSAPILDRAELDSRVRSFVIGTLDKHRESSELRFLSGTQPVIASTLGVLAQLLDAQLTAKPEDQTAESSARPEHAKKTSDLIEAFTGFYAVCSPRSVMFRMCTSFVVTHLTSSKPWPAWTVVLVWIQCFAKLLGHLDSAYMDLGRQSLATMISVMKQLPAELVSSDQMDDIMGNLVTFFDISPAEDEPMTTSSRFDALSARDQVEFVALVYHLPRYPVALVRALTGCCKSSNVSSEAKSFLIDIIFQRREALDMAHLVSFLISSALNPLRASTSNDTVAAEKAVGIAYREHLELVHHVCRVFRNMNLGATLPKLLNPALSRQSSDRSNMQLHTLTLLYRTCLLSAIPDDEESVVTENSQIATEMENTLVKLLVQSLTESFHQRSSGSLAVDSLKSMEDDSISTLQLCASVLWIPFVRHLLTGSGDQPGDVVARSLRILQLLARSPKLTDIVARSSSDVAVLLATVSSGPSNEEVARLVRQLHGDLELVAAGRS